MFTLVLVHYTNIITSAKNKQLQLSLMEMSVVTEVTNKCKYFA